MKIRPITIQIDIPQKQTNYYKYLIALTIGLATLMVTIL